MFLKSTQPVLGLDGAVTSACFFNDLDFSPGDAGELGVLIPPRWHKATPRRQAEFVAGRYCAHLALQSQEAKSTDVAMTESRAPIWPSGFVGSITHAGRYAAATIALKQRYRAIGIDFEVYIPTDQCADIQKQLLTKHEINDLTTVHFSLQEATTLIFSAKESIYKCLHPLIGSFFDFQDAEIFDIDPSLGTFQFRLLKDLNSEFTAGLRFHGTFASDPHGIHTAVAYEQA
jgi:enterobactin synthetase component D